MDVCLGAYRGFQGDTDKIQIHTDSTTRKVLLFLSLLNYYYYFFFGPLGIHVRVEWPAYLIN